MTFYLGLSDTETVVLYEAMKTIKNKRNIDSIPPEEIRGKHRQLKFTFKGWLFFSFMLQICLVLFNYWLIIQWIDTTFTWTLYLHFPNLLRAILALYILAFIDVKVINIMGVGKYYKILRHFTYYKPLGLWLFIGFADLYILRYSVLLIDLFYLIFSSSMVLQLVLYVVLDVLLVSEFYLSIHFVYYWGVWKNIRETLLIEPSLRKTNPRSLTQTVIKKKQLTNTKKGNKIITL